MQAVARKFIHLLLVATIAGCASAVPNTDPGAAYCEALEELLNRCTTRFMSSPVARGDQSGCVPVSEALKPEISAALAGSAPGSLRYEQITRNVENANGYLFDAFLHQIVVRPDFLIDNCRDIASWKQ
ncbi:hypothetical protein [Dongia sp. agr-C8]